jgi:hypothetical protein
VIELRDGTIVSDATREAQGGWPPPNDDRSRSPAGEPGKAP